MQPVRRPVREDERSYPEGTSKASVGPSTRLFCLFRRLRCVYMCCYDYSF